MQWKVAPSPSKARWLSVQEREWLQHRQDTVAAAAAAASGSEDRGTATELPSKWSGAKADLRAVRGELQLLCAALSLSRQASEAVWHQVLH